MQVLDEVDDIVPVDDIYASQGTSPQEPSARRSTNKRGVCKICQKPATSGRTTYCDDHAPGGDVRVRLSKPGKKGSVSTRITDDSMTTVFAKLLLVMTLIIAWSSLRRLGISDPNGSAADDLAVTDEEAQALAAPFARIFNQTPIGVKYGNTIVENQDVIGALMAAWEYSVRFKTTMGQYTQHRAPAPVNNGGPSNESTESPESTGFEGFAPGSYGDFLAVQTG